MEGTVCKARDSLQGDILCCPLILNYTESMLTKAELMPKRNAWINIMIANGIFLCAFEMILIFATTPSK